MRAYGKSFKGLPWTLQLGWFGTHRSYVPAACLIVTILPRIVHGAQQYQLSDLNSRIQHHRGVGDICDLQGKATSVKRMNPWGRFYRYEGARPGRLRQDLTGNIRREFDVLEG